jgi:hypothetical protein
MKARHVPGPGVDETVVSYSDATTTNRQWLLADERGSTIAYADASGAATTINTYDEYGVPAGGNAGRFQYTGQIWVAEAGVYHFKARKARRSTRLWSCPCRSWPPARAGRSATMSESGAFRRISRPIPAAGSPP